MKATKIMGVVLGALLVAALFTGAAAAADVDLGPVYAYALYSKNIGDTSATPIDVSVTSTWTDKLGNTVTFLKDDVTVDNAVRYYIDGTDLVEGEYTAGFNGETYHINVMMPSVALTGSVYKVATNDLKFDKKSDLVGGLVNSVVMNDKFIVVPVIEDTFVKDKIVPVAFTNPDGIVTSIDPANAFNIDIEGETNLKAVDLGIWTMQAYFVPGEKYSVLGGKNGHYITKLAPMKYILGKPYTFTVVSSDTSKKVEALTPEIVQGGYATIQITAPTGEWPVYVDNGEIPAGTPLVTPLIGEDKKEVKGYYIVTIGSEGVVTFPVTTKDTSNIKVELHDKEAGKMEDVLKSVTVKVKSGAITAEAAEASVIIGNEFDVEGTNDLGGQLNFFIKGTNFAFQPVMASSTAEDYLTTSGKVWSETIDTFFLENGNKKPDAGTYTIYIASLDMDGMTAGGKTIGGANGLKVEDMDESKYVKAYATVSVALKQPFITITKAPEVLVQGEKLVVEGTAEGEPNKVQYYIFGTNYFNFGDVAVTDGTYSVELQKSETVKDKMAAGQYFLVIQHPMYDKDFNIGAYLEDKKAADDKKLFSAGDVVLNKNGKWVDGTTVVFNVNSRQSANAAQALCDNLDNQDIDDMYAKASFVVAGPTSYIDALPTQITKGQVLTVSGTTTGHKDDVVTVELLSTAFAAIPKEAVGSASFVALTTKIGDDGVWSISFDTSSLNADEYTCSVAVGQLNAETAKISIVEGTNPQPTQTTPVNPTVAPTAQPTATPATPGFGALAALAGLGAVAVLLLRRQ